MGVKFDKLDLMILNELRENCKQSIRQLAKKLGTHPNTLMQRIKNLENEKIIIKYSAQINFKKIGYDLHTLIWIKVTKDARSGWDVLDDLKKVSALASCYAVTGVYDILAIARTKNRDELTKLIKVLNSKKYIVETNTEFILEPFKSEYEFNPMSEWSFFNKKKR